MARWAHVEPAAGRVVVRWEKPKVSKGRTDPFALFLLETFASWRDCVGQRFKQLFHQLVHHRMLIGRRRAIAPERLAGCAFDKHELNTNHAGERLEISTRRHPSRARGDAKNEPHRIPAAYLPLLRGSIRVSAQLDKSHRVDSRQFGQQLHIALFLWCRPLWRTAPPHEGIEIFSPGDAAEGFRPFE